MYIRNVNRATFLLFQSTDNTVPNTLVGDVVNTRQDGTFNRKNDTTIKMKELRNDNNNNINLRTGTIDME